jgi:hypothetical protein
MPDADRVQIDEREQAGGERADDDRRAPANLIRPVADERDDQYREAVASALKHVYGLA